MNFESIHNFYENKVIEVIRKLAMDEELPQDEDFLNDVACVALNQLPARYVRHNVDMVFYMTPQEREQIETEVSNAVRFAISYVNKHNGTERPQTYSQQT